MKLYAQIGHGLGDKLAIGLGEGIIDGGIFSPKDLQVSTMTIRIKDIRAAFPKAQILLDPQFYASPFINNGNANMGCLPDWPYFSFYRSSDLERVKNIQKVLSDCFDCLCAFNTTSIIAPNIMISKSLDSRESVIAKNFLREASEVYSLKKDKRPLYASLIINREALQDRREFEEFLNDITRIENPPEGVYLIIAGRSPDARSDYFHTDVICNWLMLNLSFSINGIKVINGYSDLMSPFLGAVGGFAGATGWWSNLRMFSMERFCPSRIGGGRLPIIRYLSKILLNRITFSEKDAISYIFPKILNGLLHDGDYVPEPDRSMEVLQSWEALRELNHSMASEDIGKAIKKCRHSIEFAKQAYIDLAASGIALEGKSRGDHLEAIEEGLEQFVKRAELD